MAGADVGQQHLDAAAEIERPLAARPGAAAPPARPRPPWRPPRSARAAARRRAAPRARPPQQLRRADRPVDLRAGEGGGAQHVVEVRMGECDMRHPAAQQRLAPGCAARPPPAASSRCRTSSTPSGPATSAGGRVPDGEPPPPRTVAQPLPAELFPRDVHTATLSATTCAVPRRRGRSPLPRAHPARRTLTGGIAGTRTHRVPGRRRRTTAGGVRGAQRTQTRSAARHRPGLRRHRGARRLQGAHRAAQPRGLPGDRAQRHGGAGGRGLHRPAAHQRRAHPDRQGLPALRRQARGRQAAVVAGAPGHPELPRRRRRPRRRRGPHGPAARAADPAGRRRAVPVADPLDGPARGAAVAGAGPADARPDHGHRPGRAAYDRLPGAVRRHVAGGSAGPAQQPGRRPTLRGRPAAGAGPAGVLRDRGPRHGLHGALHPPRDPGRGDRGAADDRRHLQPHPLRARLPADDPAGAGGTGGAGRAAEAAR